MRRFPSPGRPKTDRFPWACLSKLSLPKLIYANHFDAVFGRVGCFSMVLGGNNGEVLLVPTCSITCAYVSLQAYVGTFSYCASFHVCTLIILRRWVLQWVSSPGSRRLSRNISIVATRTMKSSSLRAAPKSWARSLFPFTGTWPGMRSSLAPSRLLRRRLWPGHLPAHFWRNGKAKAGFLSVYPSIYLLSMYVSIYLCFLFIYSNTCIQIYWFICVGWAQGSNFRVGVWRARCVFAPGQAGGENKNAAEAKANMCVYGIYIDIC